MASFDGDRADDFSGHLADTPRYDRAWNYVGPDYADGTSSRFLEVIPPGSNGLNIADQEFVE